MPLMLAHWTFRTSKGQNPAFHTGTWRCGMGRPAKRWRQGMPNIRTHLPERETRALSVAMPVSAYIWR